MKIHDSASQTVFPFLSLATLEETTPCFKNKITIFQTQTQEAVSGHGRLVHCILNIHTGITSKCVNSPVGFLINYKSTIG